MWFCLSGVQLYGQFSVTGTIRYVRQGGSGTQDGSSWANASGNLQEMIAASKRGDAVYVAAGRYYAMEQGAVVRDERGVDHGRQRAFVMKAGVSVYGGFDAEHPEALPADRQWVGGKRYGWQLAHASVLSGEELSVGGIADVWKLDSVNWCWSAGGYMDNVTHVVWFASEGFAEGPLDGEVSKANALAWETVLDGFTIEGGNADGIGRDEQGASSRFGGGVYLVENAVVSNCIVQKNFAATRGGGVFMNYGGRVSDCYIGQNACPGFNQTRKGFGGGICVVGRGTVERSFVVNNSARMGGGVYLAKDRHTLPYEAVVEMSVIANNTAAQEAGGLYAEKAGVVTGSLVVANNCMDAGFSGHGKTGGVYCDSYLVFTGCAVWQNVAVSGSRQGYMVGVTAENEQSGEPASVQIAYSGIQNIVEEAFGVASLTGTINIDDQQELYRSGFIRPAASSGIMPHLDHPEKYVTEVNWDKEDCSVLLLRGATDMEAPYVSVAKGKRIHIPALTIDGKEVNRRPDIGPYVGNIPAVVADHTGTIAVVYVDNQAKVCGSGESWSNPTRLLGPAIDYLAAHGGGEVWVKEGEYLPIFSATGGSPQSYCLRMRGNVRVYGGFPGTMDAPGMTDRNPVAYRTIISGDLGRKGNNSDNTYHLVLFDADIRQESVLDGFIICHSNALLDKENPTGETGAIVVKSPYAAIRNCVVENCLAGDGAAVWANADFRMENCVINNNEARTGAVVKVTAGTGLMGLTVVMNKGNGIQGGILSNTLVWGNTGMQVGGAASIDYCAGPETFPGTGNQIFVASMEEANRYFANPTKVQGIIEDGYGTVMGGPAEFEPTCLLDAVVTRGSAAGRAGGDIRGVERGRGGGWDIGAFESTGMPESGANIRYVRAGGSGGGMSWADASGELQKMVDALQDVGGEVWVAAGVYTGTFVMREGVHVYGGFPSTGTPGKKQRRPAGTDAACRTIIQAQETVADKDNMRVLTQQGDFGIRTVWDGFTIQNGSLKKDVAGDGGAGVKLLRNGWLMNCVVRNNQNVVSVSRKNINNLLGGGVYCDGGGLVNCYITGNRVEGSATGSIFVAQTCKVYGAGLYLNSGTVYNCVIEGNTASSSAPGFFGGESYAYGAGVYVGNGLFFNNTIVKNQATSSGGMVGGSGGSASGLRVAGTASVLNCIVWGNEGTTEQITKEAGATATVGYSCVGADGEANNGYAGTGNTGEGVTGAEIFVDISGGDFHLKMGSLCINTGDTYPGDIELPVTDMDYTERIKDCAIDMGAYEFGYNGLEPVVPRVSGDTAWVYVTLYGSGVADGSSWENAVCRSKLQRAIDILASRTEKVREVWVATGFPRGNDKNPEVSADGFLKNAMFYPTRQDDTTDVRTRSFHIQAGVAVIGGFRGNEKDKAERSFAPSPLTVLSGDYNNTPEESGDDAYRVVVFDSIPAGQSARIEQLGVGYGNANHFRNPEYQRGGGVVVVPGGRVVNCYIRKCQALQQGGGVYLAGKTNAYTGYRAMLSGSVVAECKAGKGGGVYAESWSVLTNNTVVKNEAVEGGGVAFAWPVAIQGTVIWGNQANNGKNLMGVTQKAYPDGTYSLFPVNFSAIEGLRPEGNFNIMLTPENEGKGLSPAFVNPDDPLWYNGGLALSKQSSLIDAGINSRIYNTASAAELLQKCYLPEIDMAGNPRAHTHNASVEGIFMDIGAYEAEGNVELRADTRMRLFVTRRGRGRMDGSSWKNATPDLQAALNYFADRKEKGQVWVQGGYTYVPLRRMKGESDRRAASFLLNPYASLYGGFMGDTVQDAVAGRISEGELAERPRFDRNHNGVYEEYEYRYETVLDGGINPIGGYENNAFHVLFYEGTTVSDTVVLNGLTIQNGQAVAGGQTDRFNNGGGLYALGPVRVEQCVFRNNYAVKNGGAVYAAAGGSITGSLFGGNGVMTGRGGGIYFVGGVLANTIVVNNTSQGAGGGGAYLSGGQAVNSLIARNNNWTEGAGLLLTNGAVVQNTVVWGNAADKTLTEIAGAGTARFCALPKGRVSTGLTLEKCVFLNAENSSVDGPRFLHPTQEATTEAYSWAADWRVHTLSPLTDAGDSVAYRALSLPLEVNAVIYAGDEQLIPLRRIRGRNIDIGCYENAPVELADRDTLYVRTWEDPLQVADGSSWERATSDLQAAIRKLESRTGAHRQIWVAQGNYAPTQWRGDNPESRSFVIDGGGIAIYGGFPDDGQGITKPGMEARNPERYMTILDGSGTRSTHVVYAAQTKQQTWIDGFTIRGGKAAGTGQDGKGAALYVTAAAYLLYVNHCVITDNEAAGEGAAIYSESQLAVANSLVFRNRATGLHSDYVRMVNNTFTANTGGGMIISGRNGSEWGKVQNCVFWGNTGAQLITRSAVAIDHCAVQDSLFTGEGNIRLDARNDAETGPRFRDPGCSEMRGLRPDCGSVLADAGNKVYPPDIPMDDCDLDSRPRIMFATIDIGAFESVKGRAPARPDIRIENVTLCQGRTKEIPVSNEVPDTKLYALYDSWEVLLTNKLVISGDKAGIHDYKIVRMDTTGCFSEADTVVVSVGEATTPAGVAGPAEICLGEDAVLTFIPVPGHVYSVYEGDVLLTSGVTFGNGMVTINQPAEGKHQYSLKATFGECESERSGGVIVTVHPDGGISDGSRLIPVSGTDSPGGCSGTEITDIVYRYEGATGAEVTGGLGGLSVTLNTKEQTITIRGRLTETAAYTVRTTGGGGGTCAAARLTGMITVYPQPAFKFGKKRN